MHVVHIVHTSGMYSPVYTTWCFCEHRTHIYAHQTNNFGGSNIALRMRFWTSFQSVVAQSEYSHLWKVLQKRIRNALFSRPKSSFGEYNIRRACMLCTSCKHQACILWTSNTSGMHVVHIVHASGMHRPVRTHIRGMHASCEHRTHIRNACTVPHVRYYAIVNIEVECSIISGMHACCEHRAHIRNASCEHCAHIMHASGQHATTKFQLDIREQCEN